MDKQEAIKKLEETVGAYLLSGNADDTTCGEWREILETLNKKTPCGECKDCEFWSSENGRIGYCEACKHIRYSDDWNINIYRRTKADFYCADYEGKGAE